MPPGTARYWSWLFAAREARDGLLGIYALTAEWRALTDPATEFGVAHMKLAWWRDELQRALAGAALHPITRYLTELEGERSRARSGVPADLTPLLQSVEAAAAQVAGAPLERAAELESHANALHGLPLLVAARIAGGAHGGLDACVAALAAAEYLTRACADYGREARAGRVVFAVDELLAEGIDNDDLTAGAAPPRLQDYLARSRRRAAGYFASAASALEPQARPGLRHLQVLAALGAKHVDGVRRRSEADFRLGDLYNAWNAARRAAAGR